MSERRRCPPAPLRIHTQCNQGADPTEYDPLMRLLALTVLVAVQISLPAPLVSGIPPEDIRRDLQAAYDKASVAFVAASTLADMEAIHRWLDTPDCRFRDVGQPFRMWSEMRPSVVAGLQTPIRSLTARIDRIDVDA